jgi:3-phenylpropionate/trans-cinnamate dioxygenase ferredoxin subunit
MSPRVFERVGQLRQEGRTPVSSRICSLDDLKPLDPVRFDVGKHKICVVRIDDDVYAIGDTCTHADVSLSEGEVDPGDKHIECWKHGSRFSLETGQPDTLPAVKPVPVYDVKVEDGDVMVTV